MSRAPLLPTDVLDFAQVDPQTLLLRAQTLAYQVDPRWADASSGFPENILLEAETTLFAAVNIELLNERARQLAMPLISDRLAMIRALHPLRYTLTGRTAATVAGYYCLPNNALATSVVTIPAGFRVAANGEVHSLVAGTTIAIGANASAAISMEQSEDQQEVVSLSGMANEVIVLSASPIVDASIAFTAADGGYSYLNVATGAPYKSFTEMDPDTRGFIVMTDNAGKAYLLFGDGVNGSIPQGSTATVDYKVGGGAEGHVTANYGGWRILDQAYNALGNPVVVKFVNTGASVGGVDEMTVEEARILGPQSRYIVNSCINEPHYEWVAENTAGVARAAMMTSEHDSSIQENRGRLYIVSYGTPYSDDDGGSYYPPATPTSAQIAAVQAKIASGGSYPELMRFDTDVIAGIFKDVNVTVRIYKAANYDATAAKTAILKALRQYFAVATNTKTRNTAMDYGFKLLDADGNPSPEICWSKIFAAVENSPAVRKIQSSVSGFLLNDLMQSVVLLSYEFPRLGTVTVYDMDQGGVVI